jgi:uncharacterized protein (DUF433 family)
MRTVGAEGECAGDLRSAGGLVPSIHNASYHTIYQLSIIIYRVLVSKLVPRARKETGERAGQSCYDEAMNYAKIITLEPGKRGGKPCIRGLRVTVYDVLENLAGGMSHEDILREFPYLTDEDIRACLAYAADRERKLELQKA